MAANSILFCLLLSSFTGIAIVDGQFLNLMSFLENLPVPDTRFVALRRAIFRVNVLSNTSHLPYTIVRVSTTGVSEPSSLIRQWCNKLPYKDGFVGQLALTTVHTMTHYSEAFRVPFVVFNIAPTDLWDDFQSPYLIAVKPSIMPVVRDVVAYHGWSRYAYIFDSEEGFLRFANYMQKVPSHNILSKRIISSDNMTSANITLDVIQELRITKMIIDCNHVMTKTILDLLTEKDMVTAAYHYIFLDMDIILNKFPTTLGGMNLTGFNMVDRDHENFSYVFDVWYKRNDIENLPAESTIVGFEASLAFDAVFAAAEGYKEPDPPEDLTPRCEPTIRKSREGVEYAKQIKNVSFYGLTGQVEFTEGGARTNYTVDVLSLHGNVMEKIGYWNKRLMINKTLEESIHADFSGRVYRVVSVLGEPYFSRMQGTINGTDSYEGFCVDLLNEIKKVLANKSITFNYTFHVVGDGNYGNPTRHGKWDGMIGEILDGKADLAVAGITITKKRQKVVDFTKPFMDFGISIMLKKPAKESRHFDFLGPFSIEIWICLFLALIGITLTLFEVSRFSENEWYTQSNGGGEDERINEFGFFNSMWYAIGSFMQQGTEYSPRSMAGRIAGGVCWFFTLIILASYTANLAAFLTMQRMNTPIKSSADLAKQTEVSYGTQGDGTTLEFFRDSTIPTFQTMWEFMFNKEPSPFVSGAQEGWERVWKSEDGSYAYLVESTTNKYYNQKKPCKTMAVQERLSSSSYGIAVSKSLKGLTKDLTLAILELREKAKIKVFENKWWTEKGECDNDDEVESSSGTHALTLEQLAGLFYILLGGLMIAVLITLLRIVKRTIVEEQINLSKFTSLRFFQSLWNFGSTSATTEKKPVGDSPRTPTISTGSSSRDTAPLTLKIPREVKERSRCEEPIPTDKRSYRGY
ncbi:glutamate receptor 2-like isoform X2 [Apostichopus japonicus]|uniref:glutamate receptor 2-like isoform X2 n=1 Tax=Stichopus japonicus TaxID=307972 RepID=UPI003AB74379